MKNHSQADRLNHALSDMALMFRSATDPTDCRRMQRGMVTPASQQKAPCDAHIRQAAALIENAAGSHARLAEVTGELLGSRAALPELAPVLLARYAESPKGDFLRSTGASEDLILLSEFFDSVHEEYLKVVRIPTVDVDVGGRLRGNGIEILVPNRPDGSSWELLSTGAATSYVWLILTKITNVHARVRIRFTWAGDESVGIAELRSDGPEIWSVTAFPPGAAWSSRTATVLHSSAHAPSGGTVLLEADLSVEASARWTHKCTICVDLGEPRSAPPVRPHEITVADAQPSPAWRPRDFVTNLDPAERLRLIDLYGDFFADSMRAIRELAGVIGPGGITRQLARSVAEVASMR